MRKKDDALRETLLGYARDMAGESGVEAINIRALAKQAGISVGTVYNYFSSKDDLLLALTEAYWQRALVDLQAMTRRESAFVCRIGETYAFLLSRVNDSGGLLMGSLGNVAPAGRKSMRTAQRNLRSMLLQWMQEDSSIPSALWHESFSREACVDFVMLNLMANLGTNATDIKFFLEILQRILYETKEYEHGTGIAGNHI